MNKINFLEENFQSSDLGSGYTDYEVINMLCKLPKARNKTIIILPSNFSENMITEIDNILDETIIVVDIFVGNKDIHPNSERLNHLKTILDDELNN